MGKGTGRKNKSTSEATVGQQTASYERSSLTIVSEPGGRWSWFIELDGKVYTSGLPPASGPARFNELSSALSSAELNYGAARWRNIDQRRLDNAKRTMKEATPPPGD